MKAILEFDLPEEAYEFGLAIQSKNLSGAMFDIEQQLRSWYKYGHEFKDADEAIREIRDYFYRVINDYNITLLD
jgi:hypothetical protein